MAKSRRTFDVEKLRNMVNSFLLNSDDKYRGERLGMASLLGGVLMKTNNYRGFSYIPGFKMLESEYGKSVGIIYDYVELNHQYPDDSRRFYFKKQI
jgi:hypothetical protein